MTLKENQCVVCGGKRGTLLTYHLVGLVLQSHKDCWQRIPKDYLLWFLTEAGKK